MNSLMKFSHHLSRSSTSPPREKNTVKDDSSRKIAEETWLSLLYYASIRFTESVSVAHCLQLGMSRTALYSTYHIRSIRQSVSDPKIGPLKSGSKPGVLKTKQDRVH